MKLLNLGNAIYLAALLVVAYALLKFLNAQDQISQVDLGIAFIAVLVYLLSMAFWNYAWGQYLDFNFWQSSKLGFAAQLGGMTPLSLGADALRGYYAKKAKSKFVMGFAASFATKFLKTALALIFSALGIGMLLVTRTHLKGSLILGVGIPILMLAGVYFLTRNYASSIVSAISLKKIKQNDMRDFSKKLKLFIFKPSRAVLLLLFLSLVCEFAAFVLSFSAFGIYLDLSTFYLIFILLFFTSKAFFAPQGIGITELIGLFVFSNIAETSLVAAALLLWGIVRIWIPLIVSGLAALAIKDLELG